MSVGLLAALALLLIWLEPSPVVISGDDGVPEVASIGDGTGANIVSCAHVSALQYHNGEACTFRGGDGSTSYITIGGDIGGAVGPPAVITYSTGAQQ